MQPKRRRVFYWAAGLVIVAVAGRVGFGVIRSRNGRTHADAAKARPAFTIFVLGGSTALGDPYAPKADFGRIVSWFFDGRFKGRPIRVVNLGGPGKTAREVVDDAREVAESRFEPETAAALLYLGNNEFLRFDEHRDLRSELRTLFDRPTVAETERQQVYREYGESIQRIIDILQQAGISVIASTIAVNMKDWEPNRSVLRDQAMAPVIQRLLSEGDRKREGERVEEALADYKQILVLDSTFALAWKRAGDCHRMRSRSDAARDCYQRAVNLDGNPYRETSEQTRILRDVCSRRRVPVVDAAALLEAASPDRLIGFEIMWDNCHPTLEGYARIARGFAEAMALSLGEDRRPGEIDLPALERALQIDGEFKRRVIATRGQYCYLSSLLTWDPEERLSRGEFYLQQALASKPDDADVLSSLAILAAVRGRAADSMEYWRRAYRAEPRSTLQRADHPYVRQLMQRMGIDGLAQKLAGR
jgi:tetratricopeptide (TPR) repeat protein